jgi:hypothetical protein
VPESGGNNKEMAITVEMQNTGDPRVRTEVVAMIEDVLSGRAGEWRVSIIGTRENDNWEMKIEGPIGFQRSYTLAGAAGEHQSRAIHLLLLKLLPVSS